MAHYTLLAQILLVLTAHTMLTLYPSVTFYHFSDRHPTLAPKLVMGSRRNKHRVAFKLYVSPSRGMKWLSSSALLRKHNLPLSSVSTQYTLPTWD